MFVSKTNINISYILKISIIANPNTQLIITNNKILNNTIVLLSIYNKKS